METHEAKVETNSFECELPKTVLSSSAIKLSPFPLLFPLFSPLFPLFVLRSPRLSDSGNRGYRLRLSSSFVLYLIKFLPPFHYFRSRSYPKINKHPHARARVHRGADRNRLTDRKEERRSQTDRQRRTETHESARLRAN